MAGDPKFQELVGLLSASTKATAQRKAEDDRLDAEGIVSAARAFEPIQNFLNALGDALKNGVDSSISLAMDGDWIPSNGRDYYMVFHKLWMPSRGLHELTFHVTGDYRRVEFEKHDFEVSDLAAIENAIKQWVVLKLKA
jgi:hypothetical protein